MSQVITKRVRLSRRSLLKGLTASGAPILVGLPPLVSMFNSLGTAYAAAPPGGVLEKAIESRFVLWFNGNGIPERYWIPSEEGADYRMTPCLSPLAAFRADFHVLSGVDNAAAGGMGNGHTNSMSGLMTGTHHTGRGPKGPSIDQMIAMKIGDEYEIPLIGFSEWQALATGCASWPMTPGCDAWCPPGRAARNRAPAAGSGWRGRTRGRRRRWRPAPTGSRR